MPYSYLVWLVAGTLWCFLSTPSFSQADSTGKAVYLHLSGDSFDPLKVQHLPEQEQSGQAKRQTTTFCSTSSTQQRAEKSGNLPAGNHHLIQFSGPILSSWQEAVEDTGAVIQEYIPDCAYLVRATPAQLTALRDIPSVRWIGTWQPAYCMSPAVGVASQTSSGNPSDTKRFANKRAVTRHTTEPIRLLTIILFPEEEPEPVREAVCALGGEVKHISLRPSQTTMRVAVPAHGIRTLSRIPSIRWIQPVPQFQYWNNKAATIMGAHIPRKRYGLTGKGQIVAVADTGLDTGDPNTLHPDFMDGQGASRVLAIKDLMGNKGQDMSGHGTHVAGSIIGNGKASGSDPAQHSYPESSYVGLAPEASLVFQATEDEHGNINIPDDLYEVLFCPAWNKGARVHSNSWGSGSGIFYDEECHQVDEFVWDHHEFLILFALGNTGMDHNGDGLTDGYSTNMPATAKNCLAIGATESNRPPFSDPPPGFDGTYGEKRSENFPAPPVRDDHLSDNPLGMAAFSSRGPSLDGRYQPDLVAPGTNILSTLSSLANEPGWGPYDASYCWMGGTSMATPLAAGSALLLRQYLVAYRGYTEPSAALLKAALFNGAKNIAPGQYGSGDKQEIPDGPGPNNVSGWGQLNLGNTVFPESPKTTLYFDEGANPFLKTHTNQTITFDVVNASVPLQINLVWSDAPSSLGSLGGLVNDLDLSLQGPQGTRYPDHANNVTLRPILKGDFPYWDAFIQEESIAVPFDAKDIGEDAPITLESLTFCPVSHPGEGENKQVCFYEVSVCKDENGIPGTPLFTSSVSYPLPPFSNLPIMFETLDTRQTKLPNSFFVVVTNTNATNGAGLRLGSEPGTHLVKNASGQWEEAQGVPFVQLCVRAREYDTPFDRVNNAVGIHVVNPAQGTYTATIKGHHVPLPWRDPKTGQKGQPYALVISGGLKAEHTIEIPVPDKADMQGGRILPHGKVLVAHGQEMIFHIIPDQGYEVKDVIVNGHISLGAHETIALSSILNHLEKYNQKTSEQTYAADSRRLATHASRKRSAKGASNEPHIASLSARFVRTSSSSAGGCLFLPDSRGDMFLWLLPLLSLFLLQRGRQTFRNKLLPGRTRQAPCSSIQPDDTLATHW